MQLKSGIYSITNILNNDAYVGSSSNLYMRKHQHFSKLKVKKHSNKHFQNSVNKYGIENFEFEILELCDIENLITIEQCYIDTNNFIFNKRKIAESNLGFKQTEEAKNKISEANKLWIRTDEYKENLSKVKKGKSRPKEIMDNLKLINTGIKRTIEQKEKLKIAYSKREVKGNPTKLDIDKVREIKILLSQDKSLSYIAKLFEISSPMVSRIKNNIAWREVTI